MQDIDTGLVSKVNLRRTLIFGLGPNQSAPRERKRPHPLDTLLPPKEPIVSDHEKLPYLNSPLSSAFDSYTAPRTMASLISPYVCDRRHHGPELLIRNRYGYRIRSQPSGT
jgi:hypothetical protein